MSVPVKVYKGLSHRVLGAPGAPSATARVPSRSYRGAGSAQGVPQGAPARVLRRPVRAPPLLPYRSAPQPAPPTLLRTTARGRPGAPRGQGSQPQDVPSTDDDCRLVGAAPSTGRPTAVRARNALKRLPVSARAPTRPGTAPMLLGPCEPWPVSLATCVSGEARKCCCTRRSNRMDETYGKKISICGTEQCYGAGLRSGVPGVGSVSWILIKI